MSFAALGRYRSLLEAKQLASARWVHMETQTLTPHTKTIACQHTIHHHASSSCQVITSHAGDKTLAPPAACPVPLAASAIHMRPHGVGVHREGCTTIAGRSMGRACMLSC